MDVQTILEWRRLAAQRLRLDVRLKRMRDELTDIELPTPVQAPAPDADWVIRLRPLKRYALPPVQRMKRLLKFALRAVGFRAVSYYQVTDDEQRRTT